MGTEPQTFLFADLAGFTALTEVHGDTDAADLVDEFAADCRGALGEHGAKEVKTIGDALMLSVRQPGPAIELGLHLACDVGGSHGMPSVRVGMHTGTAVERNGDWIGGAVNIAARVSALAGGRQVLLSEATRAAAGELHGVELHSLGPRQLRNVGEPITVYEALWSSRRDERELPIDPVCRMAVDPEQEAGRLRHGGVSYHFCSLRCAASFSAEPERYL